MDTSKHGWMEDVLRDMELYARRNELPDALHLIATPRQWFEDLVEELAHIADNEGAPEARDKLFDARDAWGRQKDPAPGTGVAIASCPADKSDDRA